ncbi:protein kinase domain-containing protein [Microbulbifer pacificus]|uniref:protein kinase domain-containing protein n=1 Tax=Microbulbifer pacificus TaxID=407164 RepID=UPI000CF41BAD|nr:protein kinase [Microbulbifer pacificus]
MNNGDTEHWRAADQIFERLLELPEAERDSALEQLSAPAEVMEKVRDLLRAHRQPDAFLERPAFTACHQTSNALAGRELGGWRLSKQLGSGGSAVVYSAQRSAPGVEQRAAIKIFTLASLCHLGAERFRRELAILAKLNHPHIASLIDSGVSDDGTYWLAMQLVEGERIDCHCERLDTRSVVKIFLQLCDAVAYAHRALVVHRDIKPSNVLVEKGGHVRLLDFGIGRFADDGEDITRTLWRALTPGYAAPEQFTGSGISTAMDVYGLGALLYRLLCGSPPRDSRDMDTHVSLTAPSGRALTAGASYRRHYPALKQDLDKVLQKALDLDPCRRYASADALAEELRRWLQGEPVLAQPPNPFYLWKKFVQRNRTAVAMSFALVMALVVGVTGTLWQARLAKSEANNAQSQARRAVLVRDFLQTVMVSTDPAEGRVPNAHELLTEGARRAREEIAGVDPVAAADILLLTGSSRLDLNQMDKGAKDLREALELLRDAGGGEPRELSRIHWNLGRYFKIRGPIDSAIKHYRESLALMSRWPAPAEEKIAARSSLGSALMAAGKVEEAEVLIRQSLQDIAAAGLEVSHLHLDTLNHLSTVIYLAGRSAEEQLPVHEKRFEVARKLYGDDNGWYAYTLADAVPTYRKMGLNRAATELAERAEAVAKRIYRAPHLVKAVAICNHAAVLLQDGNFEEALRRYDESIAVDTALNRNDLHAESCLRGRAYARAARGEYQAALADLSQSREMLVSLDRGDSPQWLANCGMETSVLLRMGRKSHAAGVLNECGQREAASANELPLDYEQARAELYLSDGELERSARILSSLRERYAPEQASRRWMRPWMLSLVLARRLSQENPEGVTQAMVAFGRDSTIAQCADAADGSDTASCLAFP